MGWDVREVWVGVSKQHQERCTRWRTTSPTPNPTGTAATNSNVLLYSCCYKNSMSVGRQEGGEKKEKATRSVAKNNVKTKRKRKETTYNIATATTIQGIFKTR